MDTSTIFKAYDIRGTYPDQLNEDLSRAIGSAFATFVDVPRIVVARDMRPSGVSLVAAFAEGVRRAGVEVLDLGLASTDFLYYASGHLDTPGAMFTASHNPAGYNGLKLCFAGAKPIGAESGLKEIEAMTHLFLATPASGDLAPQHEISLMEEWVAHVLSFTEVSAMRPLKIVADTANGMGGFIAPEIFASLPFDLEIMYPELDGTFPNHPADPLNPANIVDLQRRVLEVGADIGLAFDGDADRVFLIDEKAQPISGSTTTAMVAASMLDKNPGATILYNVICSKSVPAVITEHGGIGVRTRVGHSYIKSAMAETNAIFGGEHSGHYYYRDNFRADSGIITAMVVLELLCRASVPLSALVAPFNRFASSGEINTTVTSPAASVAAISESLRIAGETSIDLMDGLTADYGDWWFNLRPSNTEPLLRLNVEAPTDDEVARHVSDVLAMIAQVEA
jgi:phosphomannomutase